MVNEIRIYFEGNDSLKRGFRIFFKEIDTKAAKRGFHLRFIDGGSDPIEDYKIALKKHPDAWNFALLDSEGPYSDTLFQRRCEDRSLARSHSRFVFWMVQLMESWFLADQELLREYYGKGFQQSSLPSNPNIETISKQDVNNKLKAATKKSGKGPYHKRKHAPDLLSRIDPELVKSASPQCRRIFDTVLNKLSSSKPMRRS